MKKSIVAFMLLISISVFSQVADQIGSWKYHSDSQLKERGINHLMVSESLNKEAHLMIGFGNERTRIIFQFNNINAVTEAFGYSESTRFGLAIDDSIVMPTWMWNNENKMIIGTDCQDIIIKLKNSKKLLFGFKDKYGKVVGYEFDMSGYSDIIEKYNIQ